MIPSMASAKLKGSIPMSRSRVILSGALLVCRVENTRCPVSEASMPMWVVSWSRISPTMMTSGSALKNERMAGKIKTYLVVCLDLAETYLGDLHRVFSCPYLDVRLVDIPEGRMQGCRLPRACRPTDKNETVRLNNQAHKILIVWLVQPYFVQRQWVATM